MHLRPVTLQIDITGVSQEAPEITPELPFLPSGEDGQGEKCMENEYEREWSVGVKGGSFLFFERKNFLPAKKESSLGKCDKISRTLFLCKYKLGVFLLLELRYRNLQ